jgi:hypothetical protein
MYATATAPSGEQTLMNSVAGYGRSLLDRGGWNNQWVVEDHYSSGEPLLAVRIVDGVTTRTAAVRSIAAEVQPPVPPTVMPSMRRVG